MTATDTDTGAGGAADAGIPAIGPRVEAAAEGGGAGRRAAPPRRGPAAALRKWGPWTVLVVVAVVALVIGLRSGSGSKPNLDERVQHVASLVRCPVCDGETAAQSQASEAVTIRDLIRSDLEAGQTQGQILASLVRSFGSSILEKPPASGVAAAVWVVPVVAVVLGGTGLAFLLVRWRGRAGDDDAEGEVSEEGDSWEEGGGSPLRAEPEAAAPAGSAGVAESGVAESVGPEGPGGEEPAAGEEQPDEALPAGPDGAPDTVLADTVLADTVLAPVPDDRPGEGPAEEPGDQAGTEPASRPGSEPAPARTRRRIGSKRTKVLVIVAGVALVAGGASWAVVASSGSRLPGEAITGESLGSEQVVSDLQQAEKDDEDGKILDAIKEYQKVVQADPTQVEALAGEGWDLAGTGEPALLQEGLSDLAKAEKAEPSYAPAHLYRGLALLGEGSYINAVPELQWYLDNKPDQSLVAGVKKALAEAQAGAKAEAHAGATSTTQTPTTTAPAG